MDDYLRPIGNGFKLARLDPDETWGISREDFEKEESDLLEELARLHYLMYAENRRALLVILHGTDASGKDGTIRHLARGLNPQGLKVHSFGKPNAEELDHDYLWRVHRATPGRGEVAIFNRSHYEEVSVVKVHPEILALQRLPKDILASRSIFDQRYTQINDFERMLTENGTVVVKFLLHISLKEQKERLDERVKDPTKNWKFNPGDLVEQEYWDSYQDAFQGLLEATSTKVAPWYVVPADKKWFRNHMITSILVERLGGLRMEFPKIGG